MPRSFERFLCYPGNGEFRDGRKLDLSYHGSFTTSMSVGCAFWTQHLVPLQQIHVAVNATGSCTRSALRDRLQNPSPRVLCKIHVLGSMIVDPVQDRCLRIHVSASMSADPCLNVHVCGSLAKSMFQHPYLWIHDSNYRGRHGATETPI